jgi:short subunit dehydrogenase-like uncharacterized protein
MAEARDLDLVLWGATGYTGRLAAAELLRRAPPDLRLAFGGRSADRLGRLCQELALERQVELVTADASDAAAMAALARRARVVLTTVGPYARFGTPLLRACAEAGTDYADITGELLWMRRSIDAFDDVARDSGARIVHACGYDSVPTDLGFALVQTTSLERHGRACSRVRHLVGPVAGGVSGGTIASALGLADEIAERPELRRSLADPDLLAPGAPSSPSCADSPWPRSERHAWSAPFVMAAVNTRVARRTRALLGEPWGEHACYAERMLAPTWARAALAGAGQALGRLVLSSSLLRRAARRVLPKPGDGPSEARRARGHFSSTFEGFLAGDAATTGAPDVRVTIAAELDPGYGATARMLVAVALLLEANEVKGAGGVRTPASLDVDALRRRLGEAGIRVETAPPR